MAHYFSYEEEQAHKEGYRDSERGRRDFYHDRYAMDGVDRAYWDGRKEQERDSERREEERREEERREEQRAYDRMMEKQREEEYEIYLQNQIEDQMREERMFNEAMAKGEIHPDFIAPEYDCDPNFEDLQPDEMSPAEFDEANAAPITEEELFRQILNDEREESL